MIPEDTSNYIQNAENEDRYMKKFSENNLFNRKPGTAHSSVRPMRFNNNEFPRTNPSSTRALILKRALHSRENSAS